MCLPINEMCHICVQDHNCCSGRFYPLRKNLPHEYKLVSQGKAIYTTYDYDEAWDIMIELNKTYKYTAYEVSIVARRIEEVAQ